MPFALSVKITGLDEQIIRFKNAELNMQPHEIGETINWALDAVKNEAQSRAPVLTGRLRNSIINYMISELAGECVVLVEYGAAQEFGYVSRGGKSVPGKKYFMPAAIHGAKLLLAELQQYTVKAFQGPRIKPKTAARSAGKGSTAHKFLFKTPTGAGTSFTYGKKSTTVTTFRPLLHPGVHKMFPRPRKARRSRRR